MERGARIQERINELRFLFVSAMRGGTVGKRRILLPQSLLAFCHRAAKAIRKMKNSLCGGDIGQQALPMQRQSLLRRSVF